MIRYVLLTYDFQVTCFSDEEGLFCGRLGMLDSLKTVMCLGQRGDGWSFLSSPPTTLWYDFLSRRHNRAVPAGELAIESTDQQGIVRLREKDQYVSVSEQGTIELSQKTSDQLGSKACFRLLAWDDVTNLWHALNESWSLGTEGERAEINEWESTFHDVQFGSIRVPFETFCKSLTNGLSSQEILLTTKRNVYRAVVYRPGILYVVFGDKVLQEFQVSVESLLDPGFYEGDILVATNLMPEQIYNVVPSSMRHQCRIIPMSAFDFPDYISTRQTLFSSGELDGYAPLLYMDGDVAANTPLEPLLLKGALSPLVSAQLERFNGDFRHSHSNGEILFSKDPYTLNYTEAGFNTGVFLVSNIKAMRPLLDLAFYTNMIFTNERGRDSVPFHEQSIMNYALRKICAFDAKFIDSITDVGGHLGSDIVQSYGSMDPARARGFVHFWCYAGPRGLPMRDYISQIRNYRRRMGLKSE